MSDTTTTRVRTRADQVMELDLVDLRVMLTRMLMQADAMVAIARRKAAEQPAKDLWQHGYIAGLEHAPRAADAWFEVLAAERDGVL